MGLSGQKVPSLPDGCHTQLMSAHICGSTKPRKQSQPFAPVKGGMCLSGDESYRYVLWCRWDEGPMVTWMMFNPSDADLSEEPGFIRPDRTIKRVIDFSKKPIRQPDGQVVRHGGIQVVNLFARRDSCSACTLLRDDPVGDNKEYLDAIVDNAPFLAVGWGSLKKWRVALNERAQKREGEALRLIGDKPRLCLGRVAGRRYPGHPLYLDRALSLVDWEDAPTLR